MTGLSHPCSCTIGTSSERRAEKEGISDVLAFGMAFMRSRRNLSCPIWIRLTNGSSRATASPLCQVYKATGHAGHITCRDRSHTSARLMSYSLPRIKGLRGRGALRSGLLRVPNSKSQTTLTEYFAMSLPNAKRVRKPEGSIGKVRLAHLTSQINFPDMCRLLRVRATGQGGHPPSVF